MPDKSQRHQNVARPSWPPRGTQRRDVAVADADAVAGQQYLGIMMCSCSSTWGSVN